MPSVEAILRRQVIALKARLHRLAVDSMLIAANRIINSSPVGNPDVWKANANHFAMGSMDARLTYNAFVDEANATRAEGETKMRRLGKKRLKDGLKYQHSDYVGGRFRNNWQFGIGAIDPDTTSPPDASGAASMQRVQAGLARIEMGQVAFISNSLPYAMALEFGHSTQAPNGVVRIVVADWPLIVREAMAGIQ